MNIFARCLIALIAAALAAVAPARAETPDALAGLHYKAVLIAGDSSTAAFDNATGAMRARLLAHGDRPADIQRLTASRAAVARRGALSSSLAHVLAAIQRMHPAAGEACFVFATSHGAFDAGLVLMPSRNFLTPAALDQALTAGCGEAPTVVILSACFSGSFAKPPMTRANRIILTAAREDRPSFGCAVGFHYTVYDRCLLAAMDRSATWPIAYATIRSCVSARELALRAKPSDPLGWFGDAATALKVP